MSVSAAESLAASFASFPHLSDSEAAQVMALAAAEVGDVALEADLAWEESIIASMDAEAMRQDSEVAHAMASKHNI